MDIFFQTIIILELAFFSDSDVRCGGWLLFFRRTFRLDSQPEAGAPELSSFQRSSVRIVRRGAFCFLRFALLLLFLSTFDFPPFRIQKGSRFPLRRNFVNLCDKDRLVLFFTTHVRSKSRFMRLAQRAVS